MASEIYGDLDSIHDDDILRHMWQQTEDFGLKKEIRTHMYKLREERLRNFYSTGDMDSTGFPPTKSPLTPSHGESLADQSFQSFKTKEIRDSESPLREFQISRGGVMVPDTSGWNIVTSSEVSPDGKARKTESIATTEGTQPLPGGRSEFTGKNEHLTKMSHQGDDRNYVKSAAETSDTQFHEKSVTGDANSGRVETKSSTTTSSSRVTSSKISSTTDGAPMAIPDHEPINNDFGLDSTRSSTIREGQQNIQKRHQEERNHDEYQHHSNQRIHNERYSNDNTSNIQNTTNRNESHATNKLENQNIQREVDLMAAQPGVLISRSVDYPDPNTKVVTETKQLPDGTTVTTRKYETKSASSKTFRSSSNQQQSTSSRTVVEDRDQRNRVEYTRNDDVENIRKPQQPSLLNEPTRTIRNDHKRDTVQQKTRSENIISDHTTSRRSSVQSVDTSDRTVRRENLTNQVENVLLDNTVRRTVKKDLSQQYRTKEFIDTERENQPEPDRAIPPSQHSRHIRTERIVSNREIDTDQVVKDFASPTPAAGRPSYNLPPTQDKPHGRPGERQIPIEQAEYPVDRTPASYGPKTSMPTTAPAGKQSYNVQPAAGKPAYTKPVEDTRDSTHQYREVREIQVDHREIKTNRESRHPSEQPENFPRQPDELIDQPHGREITTTTTITQSHEPTRRGHDTPQVRGYPSQPSSDRSARTHDHNETSTTTTTRTFRGQDYPKDGTQTEPMQKPLKPSERSIPISRSNKPDVQSAPSYDSKQPHGNYSHSTPDRDVPTITTTVTRKYKPYGKDSEPELLRQSPQRQQPSEHQIPITKSNQPDDTKHAYPAGKPSYTHPQSQQYNSPNEPKRANEHDIPIERTHRPIEKEPEYPAGKPSYTAPRHTESVPRPHTTRDSPRGQPNSTYPQEVRYDANEYRVPGDRGSPKDEFRPYHVRRPSEESYISTDTVRTNNTYTTNKISKEVGAAHEVFARSLRCVSPSDRGSVRSLRTSTTSIRSSTSPDKTTPRNKRTQRSPSRDSVTYSESSRISTSTVTKGKTVPRKDAYRTPKKPSDASVPTTTQTKEHYVTPHDRQSRPTGAQQPKDNKKPTMSRPVPRTDINKTDETIDLTTTRKDSTHHITTITKDIEEYPGESKKSPSAPPKPKTTQTPPQKNTPLLGKNTVTSTTTTTKAVPTSVPNTPRYPQKNGPAPTTTNKPRFPKETDTQISKTSTVSNNQTTHSVTSKQPKEIKGSPQKFEIKPQPDAPKASRSPYSSPERSTRPVQPKRDSPTDATRSVPKTNLPSSKPSAGTTSKNTIKKFTDTINVNSSIIRNNKPTANGRKQPTAAHPGRSDDEGFEPESPRSSSPTSSVSDLVYHKGPVEEPDRTTKKSVVTPTKRDTTTDEFINREREDIEVNTSKRTTTVERRGRTKSPSEERQYPRPGETRLEGPSESEPEYYQKDSDGPGPDEKYPEELHPTKDNYPRSHFRSPVNDRPNKQPNDSQSEFSPDTDSRYPDDEDISKEPFYLIDHRPEDREQPRKPDNDKKPKSHPPLKRSETYEERCRKILGMDQNNTTKTVQEDFITHEQTVDEPSRTGGELPDDREYIPSNKKPNAEVPTRNRYSPDKTDEYYIEETTTTITNKSKPLDVDRNTSPRRTGEKPRSQEPRHKPGPTPTRKQPPRSEETSPTREQVERIRENSPIRKTQSRSPDPSPSRYAPVNEQSLPKKPSDVSRKFDVPTQQRPNTKNTPRGSSPDNLPKKRQVSPTRTTMRDEKVITTSKIISKQPKDKSPERLSPSQGSPDSGYDRTHKSISPDRSPVRTIPEKTDRKYRPSPSPTRNSTEPITRSYPSEKLSPNVKSKRPKSSDRDSSRSPVRSPSPSTKYTETVTIVTQRTTKDAPSSQKPTPKTNETQTRPKHITTAKIQISPPAERKPSSTDIKKTPRTLQSKPIQRPSTTREDITTTRISKSTVPQRIAPNQVEKLTTTHKTKTTEVTRGQQKIQQRSDEHTDEEVSDVPSDTDMTTVIETTTIIKQIPDKKQPRGKYPFADRKDSAPVFKTTKVEKDKMTRSTSENVIKNIPYRQKPEIIYSTPTDQPRRKSLDKKRPVKCMATKTINLTTKENIMNSEEMEDVIIDIQQAKSSREASPNRMVPMPVRNDEYTGIPRYPDTVQEPDDETRRKPKIKDIPIYEEGSNDYIRCHVSEVEDFEDTTVKKTTSRYPREEEETDESVTYVTRLTKNRDMSPDQAQSPEPDDYRLSVHDKVAKFISSAEEVKKSKPSAPFQREPLTDDTEPDDCLLSVNDKVSKFLTTAESITKPIKPGSTAKPQRPDFDLDDELRHDECVLSVTEKVNKFTTSVERLTEDSPQKSPRLVSKIERQISRNEEEPENSDEEPQQPSVPETHKHTSRPTVKDRYQPARSRPVEKPTKKLPIRNTEGVEKVKSVFENNGVSKPKQRDIISRPSVWEEKRTTTEVKLQDIGVHRPFDEETEEIIKRERSRSRSPGEPEEDEPMRSVKPKVPKSSQISTNTVSSKRNLFENHTTTKSVTTKTARQKDVIAPPATRPVRQPSDMDEPIKKQPHREAPRKVQPSDSSPIRMVKGSPEKKRAPDTQPDDDTYFENVETETTTVTKRTERRSPTRPCEYYSTERKSPSPIRTHAARPKDTSSDSRRKPDISPSRIPLQRPSDSPTRRTSKPLGEISTKTPSTDSSKLTHSRKPSEATPARPILTAKPTPYIADPHKKPSYMEPTVSSLEHRRESSEIIKYTRSDSDTDDVFPHPDMDSPLPVSNVPSYMEHTISSIERRRDSLDISKTHSRRTSYDSLHNIDTTPKSAKFGVELKKMDVRDSGSRRKSSSTEVPHIEEIFDSDLLEKMLETVVGYEQRRRIRTQIRIVKRMIEEGTLQQKATTTTTTRTITRKSSETSPIRKTETVITRRTGTSPERRLLTTKQPKRPSNDTKLDTNQFIETESRHITRHEAKSTNRERSISPQGKIRTVTTTTTEFRKSGEKPTKKIMVQTEEKPIWATKNILKKPSENIKMSVVKKPTPTAKPQRQIVAKDDADCITSSYGIGPTDDNGKPLFGIRALKKKPQQPGDTTKVTGSVVTETYYSENGAPAVGERKVTVYSNNPDDITEYEDLVDHKRKGTVSRERTSKDGMTSVTRIQKIGKPMDSEFADVPAILDGTTTTTTTKQSKVVRKGSVKEMSEKFTRKGSSTSITEKISNNSYPKAGLILRTQNYSSTENEDPTEECHVEIRTTRKQSKSQMVTESDSETEHRRVSKTTKSFLNSNGEKVRGVDDVLERMRNADNVTEDGDSTEDQEARSLLNKFLGASVLMSGVESMVPKGVITRTVVESPGKHEVKTRVTKTYTSGSSSSPVTRKTCDIEDIWDEEYLKQLLEKSSNYEERRRIRARIRQIMADKEACTDIATSVKAETQSEQHSKTVIKSEKEVIKAETDDASETESEYEEIEIVEEVTDDSSAEIEEGEEEGEEGGEEEEKVDEVEEAEEEECASSVDDSLPEDTPKQSAVEVDSALSKTNTPVEEETKTAEAKVKDSNSEDNNLTKELEAKEESTCTTETTKKEEKDSAVVTTTTKVTTRTIASAPKPVSPFAKFRQLDKQNSQNSPLSPSSPMTPGGTSRGAPLFQFTDPALCARAATVKDQLLQWCQMKTKEYENVQITNFSTSWVDGLAFCALIHHFLPDAFDYSKLTPKERRYNFELAFRVADEKAGIAPLLDVEDMVVMRKPDWKCVFTYVQTIFRRFRNSA